MNEGIIKTERMICILSKKYFESENTKAEWTAVFTKDPAGDKSLLIPILVDDIKLEGLLQPRIYLNIKGLKELEAKNRVISYAKSLQTEIELNENPILPQQRIVLIRYPNSDDMYSFQNRFLLPHEAYKEYEEYVFKLGNYRIPFIPIINRSIDIVANVKGLTSNDIEIIREGKPYEELPPDVKNTELKVKFENDPKRSDCCRVHSYEVASIKEKGKRERTLISIRLQKIQYADFLKFGECLDKLIPGQAPPQTYRDIYAPIIVSKESQIVPIRASNICGIGLLIHTSDNNLIVSKLPMESHVYPERYTFASSGTILWGANPNPFTWVIHKAYTEIQHQVDFSRLTLIGFGIDKRKLYFEFIFVEKSKSSSTEIKANNKSSTELMAIPLDNWEVLVKEFILNNYWEPAAEVGIFYYCLFLSNFKEYKYKFSYPKLLEMLKNHSQLYTRHEMMDEWDFRANKFGVNAVLSVRYQSDFINDLSKKYLEKMVSFFENNLIGKNIIEIGSGIGRITEALITIVNKIYCVDFCRKMNQRNEFNLKEKKYMILLRFNS